MASRNLQPELMDDPGLDEAAHLRALVGLSRVNRFSGTVPLLWRAIRKHHPDHSPVRVLDIGSGGGDVLIGLAQRARRSGIPFSGQGCDISETAILHAVGRARTAGFTCSGTLKDTSSRVTATQRSETSGSEQLSDPAVASKCSLTFVEMDCLSDAFPEGFDVAICSLFLHHFAENDAVGIMNKMSRAARRLVLVDDLRRSTAAYALAWFGTRLLSRSAIVHTDGPRSVESAFTLSELQNLAESAGLDSARITCHWPYRMLLTWKPRQT